MYLCVGLFLEPPVDSSLSSLFMFYVSVCPPRSLCSRFCVSLLAPGVPPSHSLLCLSHSDSLHSLSLSHSHSLSLFSPQFFRSLPFSLYLSLSLILAVTVALSYSVL